MKRIPQPVLRTLEALAQSPINTSALAMAEDQDFAHDTLYRALGWEAVEGFLQELGTGFLRGPMGEELAQDPEALYHDLLRLAYRILFLLVAEARGVLGGDEVYREAFGLHRLLRLSERREAYTEDPDLWLGLKTLFELLRNPRLRVNGAPAEALGLGVLNGGLFGERLRLEEAPFSVENRHLLAAFRRLALFYDPEARALKRVNYAALDVEELGSVYESLLDYSPQVVWEEGGWAFRFARGSERKRTGSYYTPHELVDLVLKEALDPVVEARLKAAGDDPKAQEAALLSLKVLDPAAGSGHFLLGAARRLGRRLAQIRTGEEEPSPEAYREAVRDVVQNCLYAVDKNPLAVELCRMALWMESYVPGKPLSFLDHRVKCGDSLVGVLDPKVLVEGIPDGAYEAKEGDDRRFAREAREANRRERAGAQGLKEEEDHAKLLEAFACLPEDTAEQVATKARLYEELRRKGTWRRLLLASHLWTAAFFQPLRRGEPFITSQHVREVLKGGRIPEAVEALAHVFAERHRFFHWWLEFSDVFQKGGFDVVLGNPPWERLEGETHFYRRSGAYPLTSSVSSLNTYLLFLERILALRRGDGFIGLLVPTGIGTDAGGKALFQHLWNGGFLQRLLDFENRKGLFSDVDRRFRFSLVVVGPPHRERRATVAFFLQEPEEANDPHRVFPLDDEALFLFNPNSRTLSSFRTRQDYLLNRLIYERAGVFIRRDGEGGGVNPWMATPVLLFSSESSAGHLLPKKGARRGSFWTHEGKRFVPFLEAKMIHQYDHRYATYENGRTRSVDLSEKRNPFYTPEPQYLVAEERLIDRLGKLGAVPRWFLAYRNVARATDERTVIATAVPYSAVGGKAPVILSPLPAPKRLCLLANLNSLVLDYAARQKVGGTDITVQHLEQLPIFPPEAYREREMAFIVPRVLELLYTAWNLAPLVQEVWEEASEFLREVIRAWWKDAPTHPDDPPPWLEEPYPFPPFLWDEERRGRIRAELDAFYARLYGLNRKQLRYVLDPKDLTERELGDLLSPEEEVEDPLEEEGYRARQARSAFHGETFRVMKEKEIRRYGFYRTRRLVLESFLALELFKSRMKVALEGE